ncbi:MAG: tRNA (adenosine(37)-N6)-dimethylallyltransferase MiaA [Bdellovibrio sp.]|nr:tRNA (adenosine(37)-N6)-dimethylallyltransferase MiaA [Bdellovibrio sp.]
MQNIKKEKMILITGPTGTGKSDWAVKLGCLIQEQGCECAIINFDSMCFYRELSIGTAKPDLALRKKIKHFMVDVTSIDNEMNAFTFCQQAKEIIEQLTTARQCIILVGGSPFYIRALIKGMFRSDHLSSEMKASLQTVYEQEGIAPFLDYLKIFDPESLKRLHINDHYRLRRAVEYNIATERPISDEYNEFQEINPYDFSRNQFPQKDLLHFYLDIPKQEHWSILKQRSRFMVERGMVTELQNLLNHGYSGEERPLQSVGYKETLAYLRGEIPSLEDLIEQIFISTRQLAKTQRTFFKRITPKITVNPLTDSQTILKTLYDFMQA